MVGLGGFLIPEEWEPSARRLYHGHRLQVTVYCLLRRIQENKSSTSGGGMTTDHFSSPGRRCR
jgi:hypothetical protein